MLFILWTWFVFLGYLMPMMMCCFIRLCIPKISPPWILLVVPFVNLIMLGFLLSGVFGIGINLQRELDQEDHLDQLRRYQ